MSDVLQDAASTVRTGRELYGGGTGNDHTMYAMHTSCNLPESNTDLDHSSFYLPLSFPRSGTLTADAGNALSPRSQEDWVALQAFNFKDEPTMTSDIETQDAFHSLVCWKAEDGLYGHSLSANFRRPLAQAIGNPFEGTAHSFLEQNHTLYNWQVDHEAATASIVPPQYPTYDSCAELNHQATATLMAQESLAIAPWGTHQTEGDSTINPTAIEGGSFHQMNGFPTTSLTSNTFAFNDEDEQAALNHSGLPFPFEACGLRLDGTLASSTSIPSETMPNSFTTDTSAGSALTSCENNTPSCNSPTENGENDKPHRQRQPRSISRRPSGRDAALLEYKRQGFSYKQIKVLGKFEEAESTLRGRYRTLTKRKEERLRKPQWTLIDIELLREGVRACSGASSDISDHDLSSNGLLKIAWKKVAAYISEHGGSYHFGNATCKKKWYEICGTSD